MYYALKPYWNGKRWIIDIQKDGVRKCFSSTVPRSEGKKIVRQKALDWLENGENEQKLLFSEVYSRFLRFYYEKSGNNTSYRRYVSFGNHHIVPRLGKIPVGSITLDEYQSCISQAKPVDGRTEVLSKKTLGALRECLVAFMKFAKPRKYIPEDFSSELYIPKAAPTVGRDILQLEDVRRWFQDPVGLWYEKALMFQLLVGFRPGEVLGLQPDDFNSKTNVLTVSRAINNRGEVTTGKNKNARRSIVLSGKALIIIKEQLEISSALESDWLFCGKFGQKPSPQKYYQTLKKIEEARGFPQISPYCLRHTFYTLIEGYLPSRAIKTIFGHSDATDSHSLYGEHIVSGELVGISEQLKVTPLYQAAE